MTRREFSGIRDLTMSGWIRANLPDSKEGFMVSDLDFILYNYREKKCILLEIKTHSTKPKEWQQRMFQQLAKWIEKGVDSDWFFGGYHVVIFENNFFTDGKCWFDDREVSEEELKDLLSMKGKNSNSVG